MNKKFSNLKTYLLPALICIFSFSLALGFKGNTVKVLADEVKNEDTSYDRYISFGANLKSNEKATVMSLLGVNENDLKNYKTIEVTNEDEHHYLDSYLSSKVIGTRALSSVKIVKTEKNSGITVVTRNINYCTSTMYQNALITAGLKDADVTVAGPFELSGTAALVGAMKAYSEMTGEKISENAMDAATDELVTTSELAESIGDKEKAAELIAATKQKIFEEQLSSESDIRDAVTSSAKTLGIDISDEQVDEITDLMMKVKDQDVDVDALKEQAKNIYDKLKDAGIDFKNVDTTGLASKVGGFFSNIFTAVKDFFTGLFG